MGGSTERGKQRDREHVLEIICITRIPCITTAVYCRRFPQEVTYQSFEVSTRGSCTRVLSRSSQACSSSTSSCSRLTCNGSRRDPLGVLSRNRTSNYLSGRKVVTTCQNIALDLPAMSPTKKKHDKTTQKWRGKACNPFKFECLTRDNKSV